MDHQNFDLTKREALEYFAFLVEDRMGRSAEIDKSPTSVEIHLHDDATITATDAHLFCMNLMITNMHSFGTFIPFKVFDADGEMITLEDYSQNGANVQIVSSSEIPFLMEDDDEEDFENFG